jgi:hypothetical protein
MLNTKYLEKIIKYDGSQLVSHWIFTNFGLARDTLVAFRGPCEVKLESMVDLQDVLNQSPILSSEMLHFIGEFFGISLELGVHRQRLLSAVIKESLEALSGLQTIDRRGDDLWVGEKKLSVSIATVSPVSVLMHCGLNIESAGTPVPTISLKELSINPKELAERVLQKYAVELESISYALCKVKGVS